VTPIRPTPSIPLCFLFLYSLLLPHSLLHGSETRQQIEEPVYQAVQTRQAAQQEEDQWRGDREKLTARFEQLQAENEELRQQRTELRQTIVATESRLDGKRQQLADMIRISEEISPFLDDLLDRLRQAIAMGPPFLVDERQQRLDGLTAMMGDPAITVAEQYRRLMEGLLVEAEYGFTTEMDQETIMVDNEPLMAEIFRLGRLRLFYLSLDHRLCGFYNVATRSWQPLDSTHLRTIRSLVAINAKQQPVELLNIPVGRMVRQ
jgi:hypothetical protein